MNILGIKPHYICLFGAALIGAVLLYIRHLSFSFVLGTTTFEHPYIEFTAALMLANFIWLGLIPVIKAWDRYYAPPHNRPENSAKPENITPNEVRPERIPSRKKSAYWLWGLIALGLIYRSLFIGSIPIYEDDWNRYLWDGASAMQGVNPYKYSPQEVLDQLAHDKLEAGQNIITDRDAERLLELSDDGYATLLHINNKPLTTIYPPAALSVFTVAAIAKRFSLDSLRITYLIIEFFTLILLVKALQLYGRAPLWALLYAFNPLLIYSAFNVAHMDIILPPFILLALITIKRTPFIAALALAGAAAVKVWPLILAPIFYRNHLNRPWVYIGCAALITLLSLLLFWPMLSQLRADSGLSAYSQQWQRSSFLFPAFTEILKPVFDNPDRIMRFTVAGLLTGLSLYFGFAHYFGFARWRQPQHRTTPQNFDSETYDKRLPYYLMVTTLALLFLSPTGYPWYVIWAIIFIPFAPYYGAALLCCLVPLYYVRFALGEQERYHIYTDWLVPIQFGLPLLILLGEYCWRKIKAIDLNLRND